MSTLPLTFKLQVLYQNRDRLKAVIEKLNCESFRPKSPVEERYFSVTSKVAFIKDVQECF